MKTNYTNLKLIFFTLIILSGQNNFGQTFKCYIANDRIISPNVYELDVYLESTASDFNLRSVQVAITLNPDFVPAGSTVTPTVVNGSSEMVSYTPGAITWSDAAPGFGVAANIVGDCSTGTFMTFGSIKKVATYRLSSSLPWNCAAANPNMVRNQDATPPGIAVKMATTRWNSLDCSVTTFTTFTTFGQYSRFPSTLYENVNNNNPIISQNPVPTASCAGNGTVNFSIVSPGNGTSSPVTYQWFESATPITNNAIFSGATTATLTITNPPLSLNGKSYHCVVSQCSPALSQTSSSALLSVMLNPDDHNACTLDQCNPLTFTPLFFDDSNPCTFDGCDPLTGPFHTPVNTDDNNFCTTDGCNTLTGIFHTPVIFGDGDACTSDACDPITGTYTYTVINTNDNNVCTTDGCDQVTGVFHIPINDGGICTTLQTPQGISYQAVARDVAGNPIVNQNISLRFSIRDSTPGGTVLYRETHNITTNPYGLFSLNIGLGTVVSGIFSSTNWGVGVKFLEVEMDANGGSSYLNMGSQQMMSVPYSLFSGNTSNTWKRTGNSGTNSSIEFIGTADNASFRIRTNGTQRVVVDSLGKVGIGINNPSAKLDVAGTAKIGTTGSILTSVIKASPLTTNVSIPANTTVVQNYSVGNVVTGSTVMVSPANALNAGLVIAYARVSGANTVEVSYRNTTASSIILTAGITLYVVVVQ